jgi:hypothetical protein
MKNNKKQNNMKPQPIKLETKVLLKPSKYALFKYGWTYTEIVFRTPFWCQYLDKDGNPVRTRRIGVHQENLFMLLATLLFFLFCFEAVYIILTFPYPTF